MHTDWNRRSSIWTLGENSFSQGWQNNRIGCHWRLLLQRYSKSTWTFPVECTVGNLLYQDIGLDDLHRSLPNQTILWFYSMTLWNWSMTLWLYETLQLSIELLLSPAPNLHALLKLPTVGPTHGETAPTSFKLHTQLLLFSSNQAYPCTQGTMWPSELICCDGSTSSALFLGWTQAHFCSLFDSIDYPLSPNKFPVHLPAWSSELHL